MKGWSGLPGNPDHRGTNRCIGDINNNYSKLKCDSLEPKYYAYQYIKIMTMMVIIIIIIIGHFSLSFPSNSETRQKESYDTQEIKSLLLRI